MKKVLYHGTSTALNLKTDDYILPPISSQNLREDFRSKNLDIVFLTTSLKSAKSYAFKAKNKYGGNAIVYSVYAINSSRLRENEYIADLAKIKNISFQEN